MTPEGSAPSSVQGVIEEWRVEAKAGRDSLHIAAQYGDVTYATQMATALALERCADELADTLAALVERQEQKDEELPARVDESTAVASPTGTTASAAGASERMSAAEAQSWADLQASGGLPEAQALADKGGEG